MRTVNVQLYDFNELSPTAKQHARDHYRNNMEYAWCDDSIGSIKAFCAKFGVELTDYSVDSCWFSYKTNAANDNFRGVKLRDINPDSMPTGYCLDADLYIEFHRVFRLTGNAKVAFDRAMYAGFKAWRNDLAYQESDEYVEETLESMGCEFLETGRIF